MTDITERAARLALAAVLAAPASAAQAEAADLAAGEEHYQGVCRNCHGPTAKGLASFPKLAGQTAQYLTERLEGYRAGETFGPNTPLMAPHAAELSDGEIADIAAYIASLPD